MLYSFLEYLSFDPAFKIYKQTLKKYCDFFQDNLCNICDKLKACKKQVQIWLCNNEFTLSAIKPIFLSLLASFDV